MLYEEHLKSLLNYIREKKFLKDELFFHEMTQYRKTVIIFKLIYKYDLFLSNLKYIFCD